MSLGQQDEVGSLNDTVNGSGTKRVWLRPLRLHDQWTVIDDVHFTVLCVGVQVSSGYIYYEPIFFKDCQRAEDWITSGSVGQLQESFSELNVGFQAGLIAPPNWKKYE
jgi:hypothetical protein